MSWVDSSTSDTSWSSSSISRSRSQRRLSVDDSAFWPFYFAGLAFLAVTHFRMSFQLYPAWGTADIAVHFFYLVGLGWWVRRQWRKGPVPLEVWIGIAGGVAWPFVTQRLLRVWGAGDAPEIVTLSALQGAAIGLAYLARDRRLRQLSIILSSFQVLFVVFAFISPFLVGLLGLFGVSILWWMMGEYWSRTQAALPVSQRRVMPYRRGVLLTLIGAILALCGLAAMWLPGNPLWQLAGFIPMSGGERWGDPHARDGSGSGDIVTGAKKNATTIAPVDTDVYLSSEQPSLYDMISKAYGKPSRQKDKKISIDGTQLDEIRHEHQQELAASRQFSTIRNYQEEERELSQRRSTALMFVSGDVPLHLRMETFQEFDGVDWESGPPQPTYGFELQTRNSVPWFRSTRPNSQRLFPAHSHHELQVANLKTVRVPMPSLLCDWHIPLVDQPHFFEWTADDILQMKGREQIPATTKINLCSRGVNRFELYRHTEWPTPSESSSTTPADTQSDAPAVIGPRPSRTSPPEPPRSKSPAAEPTPAIANTPLVAPPFWPAELDYAKSLPRGWEQIEWVESFLRRNFILDPTATIAADVPAVLPEFWQQRRGPDYLFATAAAVALRELGYQTRLVQGLYADPREYDPRSQMTIVWDHNMHTWAEVCVDGHNWIPVEASPGYTLPIRSLTFWQEVTLWGRWAFHWLRWNWLSAVGLALFLIVLVFNRHRVFDGLSGGLWWLSAILPDAQRVKVCEAIVRLRLWAAGLACPAERTLRHWVTSQLNRPGVSLKQLKPFLDLIDQLKYRGSVRAADRQALAASCRSALRAIQVNALANALAAERDQRVPLWKKILPAG